MHSFTAGPNKASGTSELCFALANADSQYQQQQSGHLQGQHDMSLHGMPTQFGQQQQQRIQDTSMGPESQSQFLLAAGSHGQPQADPRLLLPFYASHQSQSQFLGQPQAPLQFQFQLPSWGQPQADLTRTARQLSYGPAQAQAPQSMLASSSSQGTANCQPVLMPASHVHQQNGQSQAAQDSGFGQSPTPNAFYSLQPPGMLACALWSLCARP